MSNDDTPTMPWAVVSQADTIDRLPNGNTGAGVNVTYQTGDGSTFVVFVPMADYRDVGKVRAMIAADVAHRSAVASLAGE